MTTARRNMFIRNVPADAAERIKRTAHGSGLTIGQYLDRLSAFHLALTKEPENELELRKAGLAK